MSFETAFALWDWPSAVGLFTVGILIGAILLPFAWSDRNRAYPVWMAGFLVMTVGLAFFTFLIVARLFTHPEFAVRTIGTAAEWAAFTGGTIIGLRIRT